MVALGCWKRRSEHIGTMWQGRTMREWKYSIIFARMTRKPCYRRETTTPEKFSVPVALL